MEKDMLVPATVVHKKKYPEFLLKAIDWAMEIDPKKRPQSVEEFKQAISVA
jgi:hypothetical protein